MSQKTDKIRSNFASKTLLAQILASEGINVIHSAEAKTASFDIKGRKLILPNWESMSNELYDMFVGHEVGHALFTPYNKEKEKNSTHSGNWSADAQEIGGDKYGDIAQQYLNIVEDVRIERMMKEKFPGLRRDFVVAYDELLSKNFFDLKNNPANTRLFVDRANLYFKIGVSGQQEIGIEFTEKERALLNRMANTQTWEDVLSLTRDIFEYEREELEKNLDKFTKKMDSECESQQANQEETTKKWMSSKTEEMLNAAKNDVKTLSFYSNTWIFPDPNLKRMIISPNEVKEILNINSEMKYAFFTKDDKNPDHLKLIVGFVDYINDCCRALAKFYLERNKRSVSILTKQFEMKKAASIHKRQFVAKTGRLDMEKIIQYRYNDDLFAKNTILRKGKNHGFVLFIDWSGSMDGVIRDVIRHAFMIAQFCKQCNIPFVVYAFSDSAIRRNLEINRDKIAKKDYTSDENICQIAENDSDPTTTVWNWPKNLGDLETGETRKANVSEFHLIEICSSKMNNSQMIEAYANVLRSTFSCRLAEMIVNRVKASSDLAKIGIGQTSLADSHSGSVLDMEIAGDRIALPPIPASIKDSLLVINSKSIRSLHNVYDLFYVEDFRLAGTPLDEAVWASNKVVSKFRKENNVQIMNTIFLTDGQGSQIFSVKRNASIYSSIKNDHDALNHGLKDMPTFIKTQDNIFDATKVIDSSLFLAGEESNYSYSFRILMELHSQITGSKTMGIFVTTSGSRAYYGSHSIKELLGMEKKTTENAVSNPMNSLENDFDLDELEEYNLALEKAAKNFEEELEALASKKNSNAFLWKKEGYICLHGIGSKRISASINNLFNRTAKYEILSPYDTLYCIRADNLSQVKENNLDGIQRGSTVGQIKKAFSSQMKVASLNKTLLMKIADTISEEI
jgi:hypothetical protein